VTAYKRDVEEWSTPHDGRRGCVIGSFRMLFYIARVCVCVCGGGGGERLYPSDGSSVGAGTQRNLIPGLGYRRKIKIRPSFIRKPFTSKTDRQMHAAPPVASRLHTARKHNLPVAVPSTDSRQMLQSVYLWAQSQSICGKRLLALSCPPVFSWNNWTDKGKGKEVYRPCHGGVCGGGVAPLTLNPGVVLGRIITSCP
jgi:hypothetical protein